MEIDRQSMDVDIVCVGYGPAIAGFTATLSKFLASEQGLAITSKAVPGMPLQVICYERADDISFGVSGVVTRARAIKQSFPDLDISQIPMACPVKAEKMVYLLDPVGASSRPLVMRLGDHALKLVGKIGLVKDYAFQLPYTPPFLNKHDGMMFSLGQFIQWVGSQVMAEGMVQIWPAMPVAAPLFEDDAVVGVQLCDQGVTPQGDPEGSFMPGMDIKARLTVVGDGPVGPVGQQINDKFGLPDGHHQRDWAVGMKAVVELPEQCNLEAGTVIHTFGYPEPEIFGFMYVYPDRQASLGIFVPSWFDSPVRTAYRYMQHWMMHPYLWKHLQGGKMRSWGAKSIQESAKTGEPYLVGNGYARVGEGAGTTNVLTNSGVDEAWASGTQLAEGVIELLKADAPFDKDNLKKVYLEKRRASSWEKEAEASARARVGFQKGFVSGMLGMALTGLSGGRINLSGEVKRSHERVASLEQFFKGRINSDELAHIKKECVASQQPLHDRIMERCGWPAIPLDGKLLVSHQDALLLGGKVQATAGYCDHVRFVNAELCKDCDSKVCIELCSGQAITPGEDGGVPVFDREKCVHCGACVWNCSKASPENPECTNIKFTAGAGGLHSAEN